MIRLCINNLTSDANFLSKTARCRRIALALLPHIEVPSVMVTGAPLVFFWAFSLQWESPFSKEHLFLVSITAGCWKWAIYNGSWIQRYCSHLLQKRWEFLYPSEKRKGMGEKNFFFPYRNESRTLHSQLAVRFSPAIIGERVHAFSKLKILLPPFPWERWKECEVTCQKINPNWSSSPWRTWRWKWGPINQCSSFSPAA